ncbi:MAG: hypothetical protein P1U81_17295, partial [Verrucomicrobiales bacterium]|nr:hypothetical protein [Verrucomicrobiales bacterium]
TRVLKICHRDPQRSGTACPTHSRPSAGSTATKRNRLLGEAGERTLGIGHVFKYPHSYYDLFRRVDDPELKREWEEKAFELF